MAGGSENVRTETVVLQATFLLKKKTTNLRLTETHVQWGNDVESSTTVPLSDVLSVQADGKNGHESSLFRLHYIHKLPLPSFIWKHLIVEFRALDYDTGCVSTWLQKLAELHGHAVTDRPKTLLVFVNPKSGGNRGRHIYTKFADPLFQLCNIETEVIVTERAGQIRDHLQERDTTSLDGVVVVGGDGTFTEATTGLLLAAATASGISRRTDMVLPRVTMPVGLIPGGTGQGQIKRATGTIDPTTAALHIIQGQSFPMDGFCVHDDERLVTLGNLLVGCGLYSFMTEVSESNRWLGRGRYAWGAVKAISKLYKYNGMVEIYTYPTKEDGSFNKDSDPAVSHRVKGTFLETCFFPFLPNKADPQPGHMFISCFSGTTSRMDFLKHTQRLYQFRPDAFDFDCVKQFQGGMYRIRFDHGASCDSLDVHMPSSDQPVSQEDVDFSMAEGSHVSLNSPRVLNIDGDPFPISGEWVQVKSHAGVIRMFGEDHGYLNVK